MIKVLLFHFLKLKGVISELPLNKKTAFRKSKVQPDW